MTKIDINWKSVHDLSSHFRENKDAFKASRDHLQEISNSITECWRGIDADNYLASMTAYLKSLDNDYEYLDAWSKFLDKSALKYNNGVEEGLLRVRQLQDDYNLSNGNVQQSSSVADYLDGTFVER